MPDEAKVEETTGAESSSIESSISATEKFKQKAMEKVTGETETQDKSEGKETLKEEGVAEESVPDVIEEEKQVEQKESVLEESEETTPEYSNEAISDYLKKQKFVVPADGIQHERTMDQLLQDASAGINFTKKSMELGRERKFIQKLLKDPVALAEFIKKQGGDTSLFEKKEEEIVFETPPLPEFMTDEEREAFNKANLANFNKVLERNRKLEESVQKLTSFVGEQQDQQTAVKTYEEFKVVRDQLKEETGHFISDKGFNTVSLYMKRGLEKYGLDEYGNPIYTLMDGCLDTLESSGVVLESTKVDLKAEIAKAKTEWEAEYNEKRDERDSKHKIAASETKGLPPAERVKSVADAKQKALKRFGLA
jgi:hypothetical protein